MGALRAVLCVRHPVVGMTLFWYTIRLILADNLLKLAVRVAPVRSYEKLALRRFISSDYLKAILENKKDFEHLKSHQKYKDY